MSFPAADDLKERVREATDIVDLIGTYLELRPNGRLFVAICPFHNDSRPSLQVNPERQSWKCWPCDKGGDVFSFVQERENVDFFAALRILAERAGIEVTPTRGPKPQTGSPNDKATLYKAMAWAEQQFHHCFVEAAGAKAARQYVQDRGINEQSIQQYQIGYSPNEWQWLLERAKSTQFSPDVLEAIGVVIRNDKGRYYDRFRGRVVFPIRDAQQRPIGVGGRILPEFAEDNPAKYINSPETRLYSKSDQLFGLNVARTALDVQRREGRTRNLIVMEGYTDVVVAQQAGIEAPVAVCGTALGARHINLIRRFADRVTLLLDGDEAGQRSAMKVLELFVAGQIELRVVTLPDGLDPCDFVLQQGAEPLNAMLQAAPDALDFCVQCETRGIDAANDTQRANEAIRRILRIIASAPRLKEDTPTLSRMREQQTLSRLSRMFRVDESLLREQLTQLRSPSQEPPMHMGAMELEPVKREKLDSWERELFILLIHDPDAVSAVIEKIAPTDLRTEIGRQLLSMYQTIDAEGHLVDFDRLMNSTEDTHVKSVLVELAEDADRIQTENPAEQLRDLLLAYTGRREEQERRDQLAELLSGNLQRQQELDILTQLFESKRLDADQ